MFERSIDETDIKAVLEQGEVIEDYPNDKPYPSQLILGWRGTRPLHVVAANNKADEETIIITVYEPDPEQWTADFRRRKS
jgi:hypothetical protein